VAEKVESAEPSRRKEHKRRTARDLQQAALELFAANGYDETTTDEIAEQAGVSPRTFFRYFPTKDSVLFAGSYRWYQSFTEGFLTQPASASDVDAIRHTFLDLAPELARRRRSLILYEEAVASSATLRGGVQDHVHQDIATLAEAIAERRGLTETDESCSLLAEVVLVTYRRAVLRWLGGPARQNPSKVIDEELRLLVDQFSTASSNSRGG
jgi:AcrR family transcriptional regulator